MSPGGYQFGCAVVAYPLAGLFAQESQAAAGPATEAAFLVARGFYKLSGECGYGAGLIVDIAVAPEVTGIVEDDLPPGCGYGGGGVGAFVRFALKCGGRNGDRGWRRSWQFVGKAGEEFAVMLDLRWCAIFLPVFLDGADAVGADGDDLLYLVLCQGFEVG